jgi:hypothetical protein
MQAFWVWLIVLAGYFQWSALLVCERSEMDSHSQHECFEGKTTFRLIVVIHWSEAFYFPFFSITKSQAKALKLPAAILNSVISYAM